MADTGYYNNERNEVAALVPDTAFTILDVGCGRGKLGALLKSRVARRRVVGLEIIPAVAAEARNVLDEVITGDLQQVDLPFHHATFDCVVFADVLEHMVDPTGALRKVRPLLRERGVIVCSIPNIRHYTTFIRLLMHGWEYTDFGIFDRTHLRFFSLRSMQQMLSDAGYCIATIQPNVVASRKMKILNTLCFGRLGDFLAQQYLFVAQSLPSAHA
jgi:2-polyprenyl-3-methyl-5-hydroxy-6-metoxy-1,4-benzoquinol methylase